MLARYLLLGLVVGCSSSAATTGATAPDAGADPSDGGATTDGAAPTTGPAPTMLPTATGTCPAMANLAGKVVSFAGQDATVWSGDPTKGPGPLLVYYYATGSSAAEPLTSMGQAQFDKIIGMGGAIVAQNKTTAKGATTGNEVWYTGDAAIADEIVACAIQSQKIDPRHIHVAGYSAGALQTTYMWSARSGYVASVLTYSGGDDTLNTTPLQDPAHAPAALITHGAHGVDTYGGVIDFFDASTKWEVATKSAGAFTIDCLDTGTHSDYATRTKVAPQALQFFLDHPFGVTPEPYASLAAGWPTYCTIK
jgi:hypothetical protein